MPSVLVLPVPGEETKSQISQSGIVISSSMMIKSKSHERNTIHSLSNLLSLLPISVLSVSLCLSLSRQLIATFQEFNNPTGVINIKNCHRYLRTLSPNTTTTPFSQSVRHSIECYIPGILPSRSSFHRPKIYKSISLLSLLRRDVFSVALLSRPSSVSASRLVGQRIP